jgi:hypothetical protein
MATTTNYSWTTPDDTALVKDGAAAIRSLGTAIDTTVFNNASAAIAKTIVDAKGDIIAATAADTVSRLAVGANDTVLTADSSTATGLKWAAPAGGGGLTLLSTTTLSGASTTISSISGSYVNLLVIVSGQTNDTADGDTRISPNSNDSVSDYIANYGNETGSTAAAFASGTKIRMAQGNTLARADATNTMVLEIFNYADTTYRKQFTLNSSYQGSSSGQYAENKGGIIKLTGAINELKFDKINGSFLTGQVKIYGVK